MSKVSNMTELRIKYLTIEDYPTIDLPVYVTEHGEVYQWSPKSNKMRERKHYVDKRSGKVVVSLRNNKEQKHYTTSVVLDSLVYKCFTDEIFLPKSIYITHKDNDQLNCAFSNLERNKYFKENLILPLVFDDFDATKTYLILRNRHKKDNFKAKNSEIELIIDTRNWTEDNRKWLKNLKLDEGIKIK